MRNQARKSTKREPALGEDHVVAMLRSRFGGAGAFLEMGIGDDAAVFRIPGANEKLVLTTDMLVEEIDFRRSWQTPEQLGWRSLAVNISDLAAMGVRPRCYTVALGVPPGIAESWIRAFYKGMTAAGSQHGAILVGGDLSRTPSRLVVSIAAMGESLHKKVLYRSGGRSGDVLYVTGVLGKAAAGLSLLKRGQTRGRTKAERDALKAHRTPSPRCVSGIWLAQCGMAGAMMDLSDGLSMDLPRLCDESDTGAEVHLSRLPAFHEASAWGCDPIELALHGAEDFELLFTIRAAKAARFEAAYPATFPPATRIGRLTRRRGVVSVDDPRGSPRPLPRKGFDHFRIR